PTATSAATSSTAATAPISTKGERDRGFAGLAAPDVLLSLLSRETAPGCGCVASVWTFLVGSSPSAGSTFAVDSSTSEDLAFPVGSSPSEDSAFAVGSSPAADATFAVGSSTSEDLAFPVGSSPSAASGSAVVSSVVASPAASFEPAVSE